MNLKEAAAFVRAGGKVRDRDGDAWVMDAARGKPVCVGESASLVMRELYAPYTAVEEEKTVDETNDIMVAIGWGEWVDRHGTYFRVNLDSDSEYAFQFRSGASAWTGTTSAGLGPYTKIKKTKPAPATLADCVRALPRGRRRRDAWIVALYIREDAPLSRLSADDLAAADWLNNTDGTWRSPNGTVEG